VLSVFGAFFCVVYFCVCVWVCVCVCVCVCARIHVTLHTHTVHIRYNKCCSELTDDIFSQVGSLKLSVSFAEYRLFYRSLFQKRPVILRSLLIVATPYNECSSELTVDMFHHRVAV